MNRLLLVSFVLLLAFYLISLNISFASAFLFFVLTIISMVGAAYIELENKRRRSHLRLVK